ncbi:hypothetical protein RQP50_03230 [Paenibacillus sp. chi10]|uniref:Uncharacterized protein n=1 Tax=Paenibacillus suaedae TaxID=3077233 RepID=A0AAJ2N7D1_9BACL|nr:hypothetical protein [Paenibacillus sp. chi10]MDT8975254.1 hypothetical protein [Paenibacillus sp. chi10]
MPYEAKTNWKYDDTVTEKDLNRIEQGLKDAHVAEYKDITLKPGVQIVDVPEDTPFRMGEIRGRTLINLLGRAGRCDDKKLWGMWQASLDKGSAFKGICVDVMDGFNDGAAFFLINNVKHGRSFIIVGNAEHNVNAQGARFGATFYTGDKVVDNTVVSKKTSETSVRQPIHLVFSIPSGVDSFTVNMGVVANEAKARGCFDSVRVYEIPSSEVVRLTSMKSEDVAELYPYTESITNVTNPYAIATSGNLLPPFTEWEHGIAPGDNYAISEPYAVTIDALKVGGSFMRYYVPVSKSSVYTFTVESQGTNSLAYVYLCKSDKSRIDNVKLKGTVTTTDGSAWLEVVLNTLDSTGTSPVIGTAKYRNPMLVPGDKPQPFAPQSRSMWAAECQLAANPVDGTNADVLYVGDDGLPYVMEKWKKVTLDGSQGWNADKDFDGFKRTRIPDFTGANNATYSQYLTKYDGSVLLKDGRVDTVDTFELQPGTGYLYLTISNKDSGWGDKYTPTADEIKAYFLGWRMYDKSQGATSVYNRTDGLNKSWAYRHPLGADGLTGGTETLPTTQAPITATWQPYRLQFLKAKPTIEPVCNYETGLTLGKGWNMVEVGSGVVIREKANPKGDDTNMYLHSRGHGNRLKYLVGGINGIYRNGRIDTAWAYYDSSMSIDYGVKNAQCPLNSYDPTAVYHVTYTMLDPTLSASFSGSIATNLCGAVTDVVQWANDVERRLSVVETKKDEKDTPPQWIKATLINGAISYSPEFTPYYCKDSFGVVRFKGAIKSIAALTVFLKLPSTFRPNYFRNIPSDSWNNNGTRGNCSFNVNPDGDCVLTGTPGESGVSLDGISFLAEH